MSGPKEIHPSLKKFIPSGYIALDQTVLDYIEKVQGWKNLQGGAGKNDGGNIFYFAVKADGSLAPLSFLLHVELSDDGTFKQLPAQYSILTKSEPFTRK